VKTYNYSAKRSEQALRSGRTGNAKPFPIPSPIGGWNTRDSIADMDPTDAIVLDNWFPDLGQVVMRGGYISHATGMTGAVETLAEFNAGTARHLIAAANGNIWNATATGAATSLASGFGSNRWQTAQFDDALGGARLGLVNGTDAPQIYNGATIAAMTISGAGLTVADLDGINIYKSRSYFWDSGTQDFWYSATNALGGALTRFRLSRVQGTGGNLLAMVNWTRDGGDGVDDVACFLLTSGDVVIYQGDNPGDANAWALIGVFKVGAPISIRGARKMGSDALCITKSGYVPLTRVLSNAGVNEQKSAVSSKIRGAVTKAAQLYASNFGWEIFLYPRGNKLIVNVPQSSSQSVQHVMNTETRAWCQFRGINAFCWSLFNDQAYFGGAGGIVYKYDDATLSDAGAAISADGQQAFMHIGGKGSKKRLTAIRSLLQVTGGLSASIGAAFDFKSRSTMGTVTAPDVGSAAWDLATWDVDSWAEEIVNVDQWIGADGEGYAVSPSVLATSSTAKCAWLSQTMLCEVGGII
jgi:hypothetical protein